MSIGLVPLIVLFLIHFVSDFVLQTREMAMKKSTQVEWLAYHVLIYSLPFLLMHVFFQDILKTFAFVVINFAGHFITDYISSKIGTYYWNKDNMHKFFVTIGADQLFHMIALTGSFVWLMSL